MNLGMARGRGVSAGYPSENVRQDQKGDDGTMSISIFRDVEQARSTILKRVSFDDVEVPRHVEERIAAIFGKPLTPVQAVKQILEDVRKYGDRALKGYTQHLDNVAVDDFRVSDAEMGQGWDETPESLRESLQLAAERIRSFHLAQKEQQVRSWVEQTERGGLGQVVRSVQRVGVYVPGGSASYPSSVLMAAIPARVAGVRQVYVATPPNREGKVAPAILAAARIAEVDAVFRVGGAQAIAALAYGTDTVPPVDKIVGPRESVSWCSPNASCMGM